MKPRRQKSLPASSDVFKYAAIGSAGFGLMCGAKADSVITFEGFTQDNVPINSLPAFGDFIAKNEPNYIATAGFGGIVGTPDISLEWFGQWDTYTAWDGRGSVGQLDFNGGAALSIVFTPSAAYGVFIDSFELDEWAGGGEGSIEWSVTGPGSGMLANGVWNMGNAGGRSSISPAVRGGLGEVVTLNFLQITGAPSYFALDNLTFIQVPEPSTFGLGVLGAVGALGAAAMRRRKSRIE